MPTRPRSRRPAALVLIAAGALGAAGCASGGRPEPAAGGAGATDARGAAAAPPLVDPMAGTINATRIAGTAGTNVAINTVRADAAAVSVAVSAPAADAFAQLPAVYDELGVPVNMLMTDARTIGAKDARVNRRMAKAPVSRYVSCGTETMSSADLADTYAVTLTALSRVTADGANSTLTTQVLATAVPMTTSGQSVECRSTGRLERAIQVSLEKRIAAARAGKG